MPKKPLTKPQQKLIEEIEYAQDQESEWYEEGKRLKAIYKKRYGEEI